MIRYWGKKLSGCQFESALPGDYSKTGQYKGERISKLINGDLFLSLHKITLGQDISLFVLLLTVIKILIYKITDKDDIALLVPAYYKAENVSNWVILRDRVNSFQSFQELLYAIKQTVIEAYEHQDYPIDRLLNAFGVEEGSGLSDITLYFEALHSNIEEICNKDIDLKIKVYYESEQIILEMIYNSYAYSEIMAKTILDIVTRIIEKVVQNKQITIQEIEITSKHDKKLLELFNATTVAIPTQRTVIDYFEAQVAAAPDRPAVLFQDTTLTYQAFNARVNQLAHHLRQLGVQRNTIVAVLAERSLDMLIGIFGIVKAGGAYLPLDPQYPTQRINALLLDAGVTLLLAQPQQIARIHPDVTIVDLQTVVDLQQPLTNPVKITEPQDACYVIYTSGTTGKPKGVVIEHQALLNRLLWMQKNSPIGPGDVVLQKTTSTFDVSVWELFWWAMQGGCLCLLEPGAEKDPRLLLEAIGCYQVSTLHFVPSMLNMFLLFLEASSAPLSLSTLKYVVSSGEALTPDLVQRFYLALTAHPCVQLINLYGPTEATIDVAYYNCPRQLPLGRSIPIGQPIDNTQLYVLSPAGQPQPIGITGELWIGGVGLAREYLRQPELTAQRFVRNPLLGGHRLYATGDLARWLPDGTLEYLGRMDTQVKVRGYRIELTEIESVIKQFPQVTSAVVIAKLKKDFENQLCTFIVSDQRVDKEKLKCYLEEYLPGYMIPSTIMQIDEIPLNTNGKINRKLLSEMVIKEEKNIVYAQNPVEENLVQIWAEVLEKDKESISVVDDFFDLGGHSLNALILIDRIKKEFWKEIPLDVFLRKSSIRDIAGYINDTYEREPDGNRQRESV